MTEIIVHGFAWVGFLIVLCVTVGGTVIAIVCENAARKDQARKDARKAIRELEMALRHARQPECILLPAMMEDSND